eukprot:3798329-Rhodomonas_salina.2
MIQDCGYQDMHHNLLLTPAMQGRHQKREGAETDGDGVRCDVMMMPCDVVWCGVTGIHAEHAISSLERACVQRLFNGCSTAVQRLINGRKRGMPDRMMPATSHPGRTVHDAPPREQASAASF